MLPINKTSVQVTVIILPLAQLQSTNGLRWYLQKQK
jgi:hypothetical protein